ncbi:MAG: DUF3592 domain-containing protein [Pseudomonadota bacterium]
MTPPPPDVFIGFIVALMGAAAIGFGWCVMRDSVVFEARSVSTKAEIVSVRTMSGAAVGGSSAAQTGSLSRKQTTSTFQPEVRFETKEGAAIVFTENLSPEWNFPAGEVIDIRYIPGDPPRARVASDEMPYVSLGFFFAVGAPVLLIGLYWLREGWRIWRIRLARDRE